jgi:hypothetical protein
MFKTRVTKISWWNFFSSKMLILGDYMLCTSLEGSFPRNQHSSLICLWSQSISFSLLISFYQMLSLECCRPSWIKWLFWSRILILAPFQWDHFIFPLLLKISYRKVSMFLKRMPFTIGWTCPWCLCQRL